MTKKNKVKPKKRELFLCKTLDSKIQLHNYKDPHHDKTNTFVNEPQQFFDAILYKINDHAKNSDDCASIWTIVSALENNVYLDFHDLNEKLKSLDAVSLKTTSKKLNTLVTSNTLNEWTWMIDPKDKPYKDENPNVNCSVDLRHKDTPNAQMEEQNRNYFDKSVNKIVEEEVNYGMVIKVFLCDRCRSGTSYCAEKLKRRDKIWRCNICEHINRTENNRYYLYNKIGAFLGSLMDRSESFEEVTKNTQEISETHSKDTVELPVYSVGLLEKDKDKNKQILPTNSMFTRYQRTQKIPKNHFRSKRQHTLDTHYYDDATINVGISCTELQISEEESYLLFQLYFTGFISKEIRDLENSFSLMIVPGIPKDKDSLFKLDEILAVMYDDINMLSYKGLRLKNSDTGEMISYRLNLLNFSAKPDLLERIKSNIDPGITKLTNIQDEKQTLITHPYYMTYAAEFAIIDAVMNKFCDNKLGEFIIAVKASPHRIISQAGWITIEDFSLDELKNFKCFEIQQIRELTNMLILALVMYNSAYNAPVNNPVLQNIGEILEFLRNLRTFVSDTKMLFKTPQELINFKKECTEFAVKYDKFVKDVPGYGKSSDTKHLLEFADLYYYYGPIECLVPVFEDSQIVVAQIRDSYNFKKCLNVLHSMNKVDVIMRNYFSLYAENFILFGCSHSHGRLDDLLLASKIKDQNLSDPNCLLMFRSEDSLEEDDNEFCINTHMKILNMSRKAVLNLEAFKSVQK